MVALSLIAVVVVVATCGLGSFLLLEGSGSVVGAEPTPTQTVPRRDISSRTADPNLLTAADVFPNEQITVDATIPPYQRIGAAQVGTDCRVAANGDLGKLLVTLGCNQVVRATYSSTEGSYLVTAGVFNLVDAASATKANTDIKDLVDTAKGRFTGYVATPAAKMLGRSATKLAWAAQGHFLMFSVIARADGKEFTDEDEPHIKVIVYDILEKHLRDGVIDTWSVDKSKLASAGVTAPAG